MNKFPVIKRMGERAILLEFEPEISENLLQKILILKNVLEENLLKQEVEITNTYSSLLITYRNTIEDIYGEFFLIKQLLEKANIEKNIERNLFHVPVCYEEEFAPDLELVATQKKLTFEELIDLHTAPIYTLYFIGFLPGFLYLGGLDERLHISRKNEPRLRVQKGAVGIGEKQTGIYPKMSPGGWQIIGNSPVPLFDKKIDPPCEFSAGDKLKFYSVSKEEHQQISEEVMKGNFRFKKEKYNG
ncbi:5-oxoprolinase subunit PxpB [Salinimicrobium soli]|uniref:5-oxoprolinase subunit PxpB n=1 Tax=Salinimicrobium soli TaxID=1254399 RepID=UPI003AAAC00D